MRPWRLTPACLALLLAAGLTGCGDLFGSDPPSMTGRWRGSFDPDGPLARVELTLTQEGRDIRGSGILDAPGAIHALTVTGVHVHPNVSLTLSSTGLNDANFTGEFLDGSQVRGALNGSGFVRDSVTFDRQ